jgi:hypothetical protein
MFFWRAAVGFFQSSESKHRFQILDFNFLVPQFAVQERHSKIPKFSGFLKILHARKDFPARSQVCM